MKFLESLAKQFTGKPVDWDELEESLIRADLGVPMTLRIIKTLQEREAWALLGIGDVIKAVRAEIAHYLKRDRQSVLLAAADTFRAAAIEQLDVWAKRLSVELIRGQYGADPAALCYDAYQSASKNKIDFLLCDTAGRQHTKTNLMAELQKVKRTLGKLDVNAPHETFLVVD